MKNTTARKKPTTRIGRETETVDELTSLMSAPARLTRRLTLLAAAVGALVGAVAGVAVLLP